MAVVVWVCDACVMAMVAVTAVALVGRFRSRAEHYDSCDTFSTPMVYGSGRRQFLILSRGSYFLLSLPYQSHLYM